MSDLYSKIRVEGEGPLDAPVWFIGEAPGETEDAEGRPFAGRSGEKLDSVCLRNGLPRETVRVENLFSHRPRGNKFEAVIGTPEFGESIRALYDRLRAAQPTVICTLGNWPTHFLTNKCKLLKRKHKPISGIMNLRGSILPSSVPGLEGVKIIPTIHPAAILRDARNFPVFDLDIKRVREDSEFREFRLPEREFIIAPKGADMEYWTQQILNSQKMTIDVENIKDSPHLLCVGFAISPKQAICFEYDEHDPLLRDCLYRILSSSIPKCFHFGTHDTEIFHLNGYDVKEWAFDTFVSQHVMWPELPRSLQYLTSTCTREPYYKDEVKEDESDTKVWSSSWTSGSRRLKLYSYNCKDTATDFEIWDMHEKEIKEGPKEWRRFFNYEMNLVRGAIPSIMRTGLLVDEKRRAKIKAIVESKLVEQQKALDTLCYGVRINTGSWKQVQRLLYEVLKLPPRTKKGADGESQLTTEENALVSLIAFCKDKIDSLTRQTSINEWKHKLLVLKLIIMERGGNKLLSSYLNVRMSDDGRCRSKYKWGTETGRWSAEKYVDGTGVNGQTFPRGGVEVNED